MINIFFNTLNLDYDVFSMVKAFYPKEELRVEEGEPEDGTSFFVYVSYAQNELSIRLFIDEINVDITRFISIDYANRTDTKNKVKYLLYQMLHDITGKDIAWGTLTGIRPTKIAYKMIDEGKEDEEIRRFMKDTYLTSNRKIDLCLDVSHKEYELISPIDKDKSYSLYVGIPFCPTRCAYCSFTAYPIHQFEKTVPKYLDALEKELKWVSEAFADKELTTIYVGGGTPTSLDEAALDRFLGMLDSYFDVKSLREFTVEAGRPDSITEEKLKVMKSHNVSRISINPQTMNEKTLKVIGRRHTPQQIHDVYKQAVEAGFENINMDIILGLPGETIDDVKHTMEEISKMNPANLTVHSLAMKHSAEMNIDKAAYENMLIENSQAHMDLTEDYARKMGLSPYYLYRQKNITGNMENIGYARKGYEGLYNILIMEEVQDIVACGCGTACKKINPDKSTSRCENVKDVELYIDRIDEMIERKKELFDVR